jgi:DNA integrity scanning protein DisA with diadenylate cyclase activity
MEFVNRGKLESLLNTLLGISWSLVTFGTIFVFIVALKSATTILAIVVTFIFFFLLSIVVLFLESLKLNLEQNRKIDFLIKELREKESSKPI